MLTLLILSRVFGIKPSHIKTVFVKHSSRSTEKLLLTISLFLFVILGGMA